MDRRQFVTSLGAVTLPTALSPAIASATPVEPGAPRSRISLQGRWARQVHGVVVDHVDVPSSLPPSGCYQLTRTILLPTLTAHQRAVIHFEGINYHGRVRINGVELGVTLPYVPAEFDATPHARAGSNTIEVTIADLCPEPGGAGADEIWLGVTPGWEAYGGIIRDAWIEVRPATSVENARVAYKLAPQYSAAACRVTVWVSSVTAGTGRCEIALVRGGTEAARASKELQLTPGTTGVDIDCSVDMPALWSPLTPNLYEVQVTLHSDAGVDQWSCRTGFRETTTRGNTFLLNGEPLVINGVCRHDLWGQQGMTLTRAQMEQDMRGIKAMGANFVRLVHYPHDRYIIELADDLGLLVSEEPGYSGVDFQKMSLAQTDLGLHILDRTVRRDWNSPAVFAWLLANESQVTADYLRKGKALCTALDPQGRFVSLAIGKEPEGIKALCDETGMDFYSDHPSPFDISLYEGIVTAYGTGKPVLFTAWNGAVARQSEYTMPLTVDTLIGLSKRGVLAGHCFWSWQDVPQLSRVGTDMRDGMLESGVVTEGRQIRQLVQMELTRLFELRPQVESLYVDASPCGPIMEPLRYAPWSPRAHITPVDLTPLVAGNNGAGTEQTFANWNPQALEILGVRIAVPLVGGAARPLVLAPDVPDVEIPIHRHCTRLHFLGHVQWGGGYPGGGKLGNEVARYQIRYHTGRVHDVSLRSGFEVVAANTIFGQSRIDPIATAAQRAFWYIKDGYSEQYHALLFSLPIDPGMIDSVRCHVNTQHRPLLLFAVLTESD